LAPVAAVLLLAGCAAVQLGDDGAERTAGARVPEPGAGTGAALSAPGARPHYKVGNPYQIDGIWYYPRENPDYDERGIASWYGTDFHGKLTANGETYDMDALTAAHKTLPMPSTVRVTNLENGRSLVLRVNDRGPFVHGRIIDVSRHASKLLGFHKQGTAKVRVAVLQSGGDRFIAAKPETSEEETQLALAAPRAGVTSQMLPPPGGVAAAPAPWVTPATPAVEQREPRVTTMYVQAGAFVSASNARRLRNQLAALGPTTVSEVTIKGLVFHRVRLGPLPTVADADVALARVMGSGYPGARIVVDCDC